MFRARLAAALATISVAATACGTEAVPLAPSADPGGAASTSRAAGTDVDVPRVSDPIDVTGFLRRPCDVLNSQQIAAVGNDGAPKPSDGGGSGPSCSWQNSSDGSVVNFLFATANEHGLANYYQAKATNPPHYFGYFEPTTVSGYPAVFQGISDHRADGNCNISVGINDRLAFATGLEGSSRGSQSCAVVKTLAAEVVRTLKGAG